MEIDTLIILLSCLILASNGNAVQTSNTFVLDTSGKPLRNGLVYHISPGLTLADPRNKTCPLDIVQSAHSQGLAVLFSSVDAKRGAVIRLSSDLNVKFSAKLRACARSTVWRLDNFDETLAQWFVTTGGVEGDPGPQTVSNWFKIEKYNGAYKLVFCPMVCNFCKVMCRDVGVFVKDGVGRLALSDVPLLVRFERAY